MNDKIPKILEHVRNKIENSDDNIKHIIEQQGNDYVRFWKKTAKGIGALSLLILVVGIWQTATMMFVAPTPEALQSSTSLLATQTTDMPTTPILQHTDNKPATITDNEIKNTADHTSNKHNQTRYAENEPATPQPDIIATAPIEQEHIPVLLAENETQIEIEQNLAAIDTAIYNDNISDTMLVLQQNLSDYQEYKITYNDISNAVNSDIVSFCSTMCMEKDVINTFDKTINYVL